MATFLGEYPEVLKTQFDQLKNWKLIPTKSDSLVYIYIYIYIVQFILKNVLLSFTNYLNKWTNRQPSSNINTGIVYNNMPQCASRSWDMSLFHVSHLLFRMLLRSVDQLAQDPICPFVQISSLVHEAALFAHSSPHLSS